MWVDPLKIRVITIRFVLSVSFLQTRLALLILRLFFTLPSRQIMS